MSRKLLWSAVAVSLSVLSGCGPGEVNRTAQAPDGMALYSADAFHLAYPADWQAMEGFMGTVVAVVSPLRHEGDQFRENCNVVVEDVPDTMSLDQYAQAVEQAYGQLLTDFQLIETAAVQLSDREAARMVVRHRAGVFDLTAVAYILIANGKAYAITCTAETDAFDDYLPEFERIVQTFQLR